MNKLYRSLSIFVVLGMLLAGCGATEPPPTEVPPQQPEATEAPAATEELAATEAPAPTEEPEVEAPPEEARCLQVALSIGSGE
ncbi:hypothetical protein ACFLWA_11450, partial [Chloroflexota bacterium]